VTHPQPDPIDHRERDHRDGPEQPQDGPLDAGPFSAWLAGVRGALAGDHGSDVPCGTCTACCTSSQFVHIEPDEHDALAHIPRALRFPAPGLPRGHVLLGYDEHGHCPLLVDGACSIYEHRPRTCRTYDCRVFPASGVAVDERDKVRIARQVRRWRFSHPAELDRVEHDAAHAAAAWFQTHANASPAVLPGGPPPTSTGRAILAVAALDAFVDRTGPAPRVVPEPDPHEIRVTLSRRRGRRSPPP